MSPEVKDAAPTAKKRSEAENAVEGHAEGLKTRHGASLAKMERDGRLVAAIGLVGSCAVLALLGRKYGPWDPTAAFNAVPVKMCVFSTLAVIFLFGLGLPVPFHRVWMGYVAAPLGWFNTRLLLGLVFFLLFSPIALVLRLLGKDPLRRASHPGSYWLPREQRPREHFERMF